VFTDNDHIGGVVRNPREGSDNQADLVVYDVTP